MTRYICEGCDKEIIDGQGVAIRPHTYKKGGNLQGKNIKDQVYVHAKPADGFSEVFVNPCVARIVVAKGNWFQFKPEDIKPLTEIIRQESQKSRR